MSHPLLHRGMRELAARARAGERRWPETAPGSGPALEAALARMGSAAAALARAAPPVMDANRVARGPALDAAAGALAAGGLVRDPFLERHQAVRAAVGDAATLAALARMLGALLSTGGDAGLAAPLTDGAGGLERAAAAVGEALAALAAHDPDALVAPARPGAAGRLGQRAGAAMGAAGEAVDGWMPGRRAPAPPASGAALDEPHAGVAEAHRGDAPGG